MEMCAEDAAENVLSVVRSFRTGSHHHPRAPLLACARVAGHRACFGHLERRARNEIGRDSHDRAGLGSVISLSRAPEAQTGRKIAGR